MSELTRFSKEHFEIKVQEGSVFKYLHFRICQSPFGFSIDHTDHIIEIVNELFPTAKFRYTFSEKSVHMKSNYWLHSINSTFLSSDINGIPWKIMIYTLGRIQYISLMILIGLFYEICCLATQTVSHILPAFQVIKRSVQYLTSHPHKPIFYPSSSYNGSNVIRLTCIVN